MEPGMNTSFRRSGAGNVMVNVAVVFILKAV
ncbi:MAG: hypothetical protein RL177_136 [Bacteroidota bacterium]|jgi:hypothetical protein